MAHTKSGGSTALGRDSAAKRLGVKRSAGMPVQPGMVIVRQRGTKIHCGINVRRGADDTLLALAAGAVRFRTRKVRGFDGKLSTRTFADVVTKITSASAEATGPNDGGLMPERTHRRADAGSTGTT